MSAHEPKELVELVATNSVTLEQQAVVSFSRFLLLWQTSWRCPWMRRPPGTYRQRGLSSPERLFRAHFLDLRARHEGDFVKHLGRSARADQLRRRAFAGTRRLHKGHRADPRPLYPVAFIGLYYQ